MKGVLWCQERVATTQAVQLTEENLGEAAEWSGCRDLSKQGVRGVLVDNGVCKVGEYLVSHIDGSVRWMTETRFHKIYREV